MKTGFRTSTQLINSVAILSLCLVSCIGAVRAQSLTVGSDAPALDIEHWVSDNDGKFGHVNRFETGKVYVVEFWATWCGPCVASMPHIVETQKKYGDKGVQIISVSDEDLKTVETFLDRSIKSKKKSDKADDAQEKETKDSTPATYRELTSSYCLTCDPDHSTSQSYMEASGQDGIPCCFIVGKDRKIEWIGHPMEMDDILDAVVENKWDRAAYFEKIKEEEAANAEAREQEIAMKEILRDVRSSVRDGKFGKAIAKIDTAIASDPGEAMATQLRLIRIQVILQDEEGGALADAVPKALKDFSEMPQVVNMIAWNVYTKASKKSLKARELIQLSRTAAQAAAEQLEGEAKATVLDTIAHLFFVDGEFQKALDTQQQAVKLMDGNERAEEFVEFVGKIKEAMSTKSAGPAGQ
jgi:thiol-disulfide isomerase/thioredoxin